MLRLAVPSARWVARLLDRMLRQNGCRLWPWSDAEGALHERDCLQQVARRAHLRRGVRVCGTRATSTEAPAAQPGGTQALNFLVSATRTCGEFKTLLKEDRRTSGIAILWLDGYYSARAGLPQLPAGWLRTVSQGVGGTCAISVNERRAVLDVIGQLHREYAGLN
jgi:hypothetical protein